MTATDELRRMLDERGVKWTNPNSCLRDEMTSWVANGFDYDAFEVPDGTLVLTAAHQDDLTPAQAIAATLGDEGVGRSNDGVADLEAGTCHNISKVMDEHGQARFACSECGAWIDSRMLWNPEYRNGESPWVSGCKLNYCPNCGARVVEPTTNDVDGSKFLTTTMNTASFCV